MSKLTIVEGNSNDKDNARTFMVKGERGFSAYDLYVQNGGTLTESEWLNAFLNADNYYTKSQVNESQNEQNTVINKKPYYFNNVADMKAYNLKDGDMAITLGYYDINDGGGAEYKIENSLDNGYLQELLTNGKYATLIVKNNEVNFKQIGGRSQKITGERYDNKTFLETYVSKFFDLYNKPVLYIPRGIYYFTETDINLKDCITVRGDTGLLAHEATVITAYNSDQDYVWKVGNTNSFRTRNFNIIGGMTFSSGRYLYNAEENDFLIYEIRPCKSTLIFNQVTFGVFDNLTFYYNKGIAFSIKSSYELSFKKLFFRVCQGYDTDKLYFLENITGSSTSAINFDEIMFETCEGNLIGFEKHCAFINNIFKSINVEDKGLHDLPLINDGIYNDLTATHWAIFNIKDSDSSNAISYFDGSIVDNLYINNVSSKYYTDENSNQYCYDTLFYVGAYNRVNLICNSIASQGQLKEFTLIRNNKNIAPNIQSTIRFNNFVGYVNLEKPINFDIYKFPTIDTGNLKFSGNVPNTTSLLNNQILEVYKYARKNSNTGGLMCSENNSITDAKICLLMMNRTISTNTTAFHIYKSNNTMTISVHAKIDNGVTYTLRAVGKYVDDETSDRNKTLDMLGTGDWKWYTFDFDFSIFSNNKPITFDGYPNTDDISCLIDAVRFF